jgi:RecA-family ATPase
MLSQAAKITEVRANRKIKRKPVPWLVEGLWLKGKINFILGPEKTGKSRLLAWLLAQAFGRPIGSPMLDGGLWKHYGLGNVLYLNAEETVEDVVPRIYGYADALGLTLPDELPLTLISETAVGLNLHVPRERQVFTERFVANDKYNTIIIDPLRQVHGAAENSNDEMAPLCEAFRGWTNHYGKSLLAAHHSGHWRDDADLSRIATWCRGATALPAIMDAATLIRTTTETQEYAIREVRRKGRMPMCQNLELYDFGEPAPDKQRFGFSRVAGK